MLGIGYWVLCISFFLQRLAFAGDLHSFIEIALENNPELKSERISLLKEEIWLKKKKKEEYYPEANLSISSSQSWKKTKDEEGKDIKTKSKEEPTLELSFSISRPHPLGGRIKISPKWRDVLSSDNDKLEIGISSEEPLSLYQREKNKDPLFSEVKNLEMARLSLEIRTDDLIYNIISSYLEIQRIFLSFIIKEKEIFDLKENLEIARLKANKGIIPEIDVMQLELQESLLKTERAQLENEKKGMLLRFYELLGTESRDSGFGNRESGIEGKDWKKGVERLKESAKDKQMLLSSLPERGENRIKKIEIELAKRDIKEASTRNMPVIIPEWTINKEKEMTEKKLGISIKFSLYDQGIKKENVKIAEASLQQKEIELQNHLLKSKIELTTILDDIANKEKRLVVQEMEITLASKIYEIARIKHQRGLISSKDLIEYQGDVFNKKKALFETEIDLYLDYIKILNLTGGLYNAYKENLF